MTFIINLSLEEVKKLLDNKTISDISVLKTSENMKIGMKEFLLNNTGFKENLTIGLSRIEGKENLEDVMPYLPSFIEMKENDFVLEFNIPDDQIAFITLDSFLSNINNEELNIDELFSIDGSIPKVERDENLISFVNKVDIKYLRTFTRISKDWELTKESIKSPKDLKESLVFGEVKDSEK